MATNLLKLALLLILSWCVMTTTHELGHLVGGWATGGRLVDVELRPWHLPHSRFSPDPRPLVTLWSGPVLGIAVPVILAAIIRRPWAWLVANFCVLANGIYLALAWLSGDRWLDTPRMLAEGASPLAIAIFCLATIAIGYIRLRQLIFKTVHPAPPTNEATK